jgi:hypothetical protein
MRRIVFLAALAVVLGQVPAQAQVIVYDSISDLASFTTTGSVPHTYMGQAFNTTSDGGPTPTITAMKLGIFIIGAHTYADVHARVQFWGTFDPTATGTTSAFSNPVGSPTVFDLGPITTTGNAAGSFTLTFPVPVTLPGTTNLGIGVNFQTSTDGVTFADDTNVPTAMRTPLDTAPIPVGQNITSGGNEYYRNASGRTDFNFNANDARSLGAGTAATNQADDGLAFQLTASTPVPEPGSMALCGLAVCGVTGWWRRRRSG